jgi:chromosome partitioning protein
MPNVAFISPKGGAGKTTAALLLALGLADRGQQVALIDSDPNKPLVHWAALPDRPRRITVHPAPTVQDIRDAAREARRHAPDWTIVDTEGSERGAMVFAAVRFDLVLTPVAGSQLDLREAIKAARMVEAFGKRAGAPLLHRAVLTRVPPALKPKMLRHVVQELRAADVQLLGSALLEKEAFRAIFTIGGGWEASEREGIWGASAARMNTAAYVAEVVELLGAAEPEAEPSLLSA